MKGLNNMIQFAIKVLGTNLMNEFENDLPGIKWFKHELDNDLWWGEVRGVRLANKFFKYLDEKHLKINENAIINTTKSWKDELVHD